MYYQKLHWHLFIFCMVDCKWVWYRLILLLLDSDLGNEGKRKGKGEKGSECEGGERRRGSEGQNTVYNSRVCSSSGFLSHVVWRRVNLSKTPGSCRPRGIGEQLWYMGKRPVCYDREVCGDLFLMSEDAGTRGHCKKLYKRRSGFDKRKYAFCNRVVSTWNGLPAVVVNAESVKSFEKKLDRIWKGQSLKYDYKAIIEINLSVQHPDQGIVNLELESQAWKGLFQQSSVSMVWKWWGK